MNKAAFLDRDGVINKRPPQHEYVRSWEQFSILPGVDEAIKKLKESGYLVVVITNQRGVALGLLSEDTLSEIHQNLNRELGIAGTSIDAFYWCPHDLGDGCDCRKPAPGMILEAVKDLDIDTKASLFIGDSKSDEECGARAGVRTYLMESNGSLLEMVEQILNEQ